MVQAKGMKMSVNTFTNSKLSTPHSLKAAAILGWVLALVVILAAITACLPGQPNFSQLITYLSEIRVTSAWPSIGYFPIPAP
jgi:hypothetical protein